MCADKGQRQPSPFACREGILNAQGLFIEILLSGFFAVACFRSRADSPGISGLAPQRVFALADRIERLRRSRWQWFAMVLVLAAVRLQMRTPIVAELTVVVQFLAFLALPTYKPAPETMRRR